MLVLGLALVCGVGRARAASFTLADDAVAFEPPSGYCILDPNEDGLRPMFDRSARMQQRSGNQLLAFFMVCDELSQIRHGQASAPLHYGMLVTVLQGGTVKPVANATRFDLIESLRATLKSDQMNDVMTSADDALKQEGVVGTHLSKPAFADMDGFAIYSSSVIDFAEDPSTSTTGVYAITLVRHFVLATYMYAPTSDLGARKRCWRPSMHSSPISSDGTSRRKSRHGRCGPGEPFSASTGDMSLSKLPSVLWPAASSPWFVP